MKQTVEEAAREHQTHFEICDAEGTISGFINGVYKQSYESFISGAEWQSKQSPWISVKERCRSLTSLSFAEWYQMERLLVAISLFHPGDRHTLRQTEDLNLKIGTDTSVTCGCPSRLSMIYSKLTGMYWNELKRKEIDYGNKERRTT